MLTAPIDVWNLATFDEELLALLQPMAMCSSCTS